MTEFRRVAYGILRSTHPRFLVLTLAGLWPTPPFLAQRAAAGGDEPSTPVVVAAEPYEESHVQR
jgi:hypothetical protein